MPDSKELYSLFKNSGASRSLVRIGTSTAVVIPSLLFKIFWDRKDKVNLIVINDDIVVIHNPNATKRIAENSVMREVLL